MIKNGDIIIVESMDFARDYTGEVWSNNFLRLRHAWRVDDINNSGRIKAHDIHGKRKYIYEIDKAPSPHIIKVISA